MWLILFFYINFSFQEGDLLFQDCDCGSMCDAIEEVTSGYQNHRYSHVAMVIRRNDSLKVIEANVEGVKIVEINSFMQRYRDKAGNPAISVGRLLLKYRYLIPKASKFAIEKINTPYDTVFLLNNGLYYCSELIYDAYKSANHGRDFFKLASMNYKRPGQRRFHPVFKAYYENMKSKIPQGRPGLNPGSMSRDYRLKIVHLF